MEDVYQLYHNNNEYEQIKQTNQKADVIRMGRKHQNLAICCPQEINQIQRQID